MHQKLYQQELGARTATTLRLVEQYRGSGRIVVADSIFICEDLGQVSPYWPVLHGCCEDSYDEISQENTFRLG
jgi:hypothetical protein